MSSNHGDVHEGRTHQHLQIPSQVQPRLEQERVYPRPISRKELGAFAVVDLAHERVRAYTDRAPTLTEGESVDPTRKTGLSAVPKSTLRSNTRSRGLSRSNAFRADTPSAMDVDRARILAFREASMELENDRDANTVRERSQIATISRGKFNNRKRTNSCTESSCSYTRDDCLRNGCRIALTDNKCFKGSSAGVSSRGTASREVGYGGRSIPSDEASWGSRRNTGP